MCQFWDATTITKNNKLPLVTIWCEIFPSRNTLCTLDGNGGRAARLRYMQSGIAKTGERSGIDRKAAAAVAAANPLGRAGGRSGEGRLDWGCQKLV